MVTNTPPDTRINLLIIGYSFGALLEGKLKEKGNSLNESWIAGVAGFGTPGAICSSLMVSLG